MRTCASLALLAATVVAQAQFVGNSWYQGYCYANTPNRFNQESYNGDTIPSGLYKSFRNDKVATETNYEARSQYTATLLPGTLTIQGSIMIARSGSVGFQAGFYFHVNQATVCRMRWSHVLAGAVNGDTAHTNFFDGYSSIYDANTPSGTIDVTLLPGHTYRAESSLSRNNFYSANLWGTNTLFFSIEPLGTIKAKLNLGSWGASTEGQRCQVDVMQGGAVIQSLNNVYISDTGQIAIPSTVRGQVSIRIKPSHWLGRLFTGQSLTDDGITLPATSFINGDCNGDDAVDASDYFILSDSYETVAGDLAYDVRADLNGDLSVDASDYFILSDAYELTGE